MKIKFIATSWYDASFRVERDVTEVFDEEMLGRSGEMSREEIVNYVETEYGAEIQDWLNNIVDVLVEVERGDG